jgi:hypothetical protein
MIDDKTKDKLLKEIEKLGNVFLACTKTNIHPSTYYRWIKSDKEFNRTANELVKVGRSNGVDICEYTVIRKAKEGDLRASEFYLKHNSPRYRSRKSSDVVILHKKDVLPPPEHDPAKNRPSKITIEIVKGRNNGDTPDVSGDITAQNQPG